MAPADFIGIGIGPANLSLAALATESGLIEPLFFERRSRVEWHRQDLLPQSVVQTPFLKDLVTLARPTSAYSFTAFLVDSGRIHRFLARRDASVSRREYEQYFQWVANQLPTLNFSTGVEGVSYLAARGFAVSAGGQSFTTTTLVVATGRRPRIPSCIRGELGPTMLHSHSYSLHRPEVEGGRVLVVGGGQSAGEIVAHLLSGRVDRPREVIWASRRHGLIPTDQSPFANEWFNPSYVEYFHGLDHRRKAELLGFQKYASDGISEGLLIDIHRRLYELEFVEPAPFSNRLLVGHELQDVRSSIDGHRCELRSIDTGETLSVWADTVILATGYEEAFPACLAGLAERLPTDWRNSLRRDYRLDWGGAPQHRIYLQGFGEASHGIADSHLSLASWRSAIILNSILDEPVFPEVLTYSAPHHVGSPDGDSRALDLIEEHV